LEFIWDLGIGIWNLRHGSRNLAYVSKLSSNFADIKYITMIETILAKETCKALKTLYDHEAGIEQILVQKTRKEFDGDYAINVFPFLRFSKKPPEVTASEIGELLKNEMKEVEDYFVVKGFLNLAISDDFWKRFFNDQVANDSFGEWTSDDKHPVVIEYSSPNTNKPLHLGHIRNNLLGYSIANILKANGKNAVKVNLVNDRGIHICKSMLAWMKWGNEETPQSTGMKSDHFIGKYYVLFDKAYKTQVEQLIGEGRSKEDAVQQATLILEARKLLKAWENRDPSTIELWTKMNGWAYEGFDQTYRTLGVDFDKTYYESDTYLLGKSIVEGGVKEGVFFTKEDGSVWADLSGEGLDEKLLLRADGTSVYITQDLGTAQLRYDDFDPCKLIYVVGNEQIYHFDVLKLLLKKLGRSWYDALFHLSYGMVELPEGKMKSREGKVVDADDLMEEMFLTAKQTTQELGKIKDFSDEEARELYRIVGLGALKYYMLKVDPKKTMLFNPKESIDFNGNTGPFIQYTYARIRSVVRKAEESGAMEQKEAAIAAAVAVVGEVSLEDKERDLLKVLYDFPIVVKQAGEQYSPALIANYVYDLAKEYNQFYHDLSILSAGDEATVGFRVSLSEFTANVIQKGMGMLGIQVPERM